MTHYGEIELLASDNFGYFTASAARGIGVFSCELDRWMKIGRIENAARGVYRLANYPPSELEPYIVGVMSLGTGAYIYGESVLAMLKLVPTDPEKLFVASPRRIRRTMPSSVIVVRGSPDAMVVNYGGVPSQPLADAIRASRGYVRHDRRMRAVEEGVRQGYLTKDERRSLIKELKNEAAA